MKKIPFPDYGFEHVLNTCAEGIAQVNVKAAFIATIPQFLAIGSTYEQYGGNGTLFSYPRIIDITRATVVIPPLTKAKLVNLYEGNLRNKEKPARSIYERHLISTNEKCPFCGDIGQPKNLDHFLPLAHFPQFAVMPINLIPACRDCNMGEKGDVFALNAADQILHPYLDRDLFFNEQWVRARYINEDDGAIEYFVDPPEEWDLIDKQRVIKHFSEFDLALRYGIEAGKHLSELIDQRDAFYTELSGVLPGDLLVNTFKQITLSTLIDGSLFTNHWKKIMYVALNESQEFLNPV